MGALGTNLTAMVFEHKLWAAKNFGGAHTIENSVLGMGEEFGELCHALIKHKQGIRGLHNLDAAREAIIDAHCDLVIFSFGLPAFLGYDFGEELEKTWDKVKARDWTADPQKGGQE